jgi:hypothetical protein
MGETCIFTTITASNREQVKTRLETVLADLRTTDKPIVKKLRSPPVKRLPKDDNVVWVHRREHIGAQMLRYEWTAGSLSVQTYAPPLLTISPGAVEFRGAAFSGQVKITQTPLLTRIRAGLSRALGRR